MPGVVAGSNMNGLAGGQETALPAPSYTQAAGFPAANAGQGMVQMPPLPPPPFLNQSAPVRDFTTPISAVNLPPLPPPSALLATGNNLQPTGSSVLSATTPPEIPPPHMVAPYVYAQFPKAQPPQTFQPPTSPPVQQQPATQPQPAPQQRAPVPRKEQAPVKLEGPLNDQVVKDLNDRLNTVTGPSAANIRMEAAADLMKILEKNPELANDPTYKPTLDAFMDKIMADPNEMVRTMGEMILQLGLLKNPSSYTVGKLQELANSKPDPGSLMPDTGEASAATGILSQLNNPAQQTQEKAFSPQAGDNNQAAMQVAGIAPGVMSAEGVSDTPIPSQASPTNEALPDIPQSLTGNTSPSTSIQTAPPAIPTNPMPPSGSQLNMVSPATAQAPLSDQVGQNLNIQEGIR